MSDEKQQRKISMIRKHLLQTGYPCEIEIGNSLRKNGWVVANQQPYIDKESGKLRTFDVYGMKLESLLASWGVSLLIECKKSQEHEWVFYTQEKEKEFLPGLWTLVDFFTKLGKSPMLDRYGELLTQANWYTVLGANYPAEKRRGLLSKVFTLHVLDKDIRMGIVCAMTSLKSKSKDDFFEATQQVTSALKGMSENMKSLIAFPVVVFDGEMFEFYQENDDLQILPTNHLQFMTFEKAQTGMLPCLIDVVRKTYFSEYLKFIERDFSILDEFMKPLNDRP